MGQFILLIAAAVLGNLASATTGAYCNREGRVIQWVCGQEPGVGKWTEEPGGCYSRQTNRFCEPRGRDYPVEYHDGEWRFPTAQKSIRCLAGWNGQYRECDAGGEVLTIDLEYSENIEACQAGKAFGYIEDKIWVEGCSGIFAVVIRKTGNN